MGVISENVAPFASVGDLQMGVVSSQVQGTGLVPTSYITILTGSTAVLATIDLPWNGFTGRIVLISTSATPFSTSANATAGSPNALSRGISLASAAVTRYRAVEMYFDGTLWHPSYIN